MWWNMESVELIQIEVIIFAIDLSYNQVPNTHV
jgi:hypothetical protein